jgi:hypothetical protein
MTEQDLDQLVASMTGPSSARLDAVAGAMPGTGADALIAFNSLRRTLADLPGIGQAAAQQIATLRNDVESGHLPLDHRRSLERATRDGASLTVKKMNEAAHAGVAKIAGHLEDGLLPSAARVDPGVRSLRRQEVQTAMAAQPSGTPLARARSILGRSAGWDAELLSEYGKALVGDDHGSLRAAAVLKWRDRGDGTERQLASRKALKAVEAANLPGTVSAFEAAARVHLDGDRMPARRTS